MKLVELNLLAYGPFTRKTIPLENGLGNSGLHIIVGPNEAGKSTALRALRAALFGMEEKRDAHLHPWDMLRVGLKLSTADGRLLDVERRKGKASKSLLFTGSDKPASLHGILPVDDADLFEQMFGLDYERLVAGGRQLAEFKGDMGQAILAAAGDLGEIAARVQELQGAAEEIYTPQGRARKLDKALTEFRTAEKKIRNERFTSQEYRQAIRRREELEEELNQIARELAERAEEQNRLTRFQTAAPHVHRLYEDQEELNTLLDAVVFPSDFEQCFNDTMQERRMAMSQGEAAQTELDRLRLELDGISRDPVLAGLAAEIDVLKDQSSQIQKTRVDLPKRESSQQERMREQARLCAELGIQPEAVPQLTAVQRKRIESLSAEYFGLKATQEQLPGRIAKLQSRLREAQNGLSALPAQVDTTELEQCLGQIPTKKRSGTETQRLRQGHDDLQARLGKNLQAFALWSGTAEQLETARVPLSASVAAMSERFTKQESREQQIAKKQDELEGEAKHCALQLELLDRQGSIPTEEELTETRARRNLGWTAVKDRWLQGLENGAAEAAFLAGDEKSLPDVFESAVEAADRVADGLRGEAERVERKRSALRDQERTRQQLAEHQKTADEARHERSRLESEWVGLWTECGVAPRTPREMMAWLEERSKLIEQLRDLGRAADEAAEAEKEEHQWRESLASALGSSPELPLAALVAKAEKQVADADDNQRKRTELAVTVRNTQSDLDAEIQNQRQNEFALGEWNAGWEAAIRVLPASEAPNPAAVKEIMRIVDDFWKNFGEMQELQHRIDSMREDEIKYTRAVQELAIQAGHEEWAAIDPLAAIGTMQQKARAARENELASERNAEDQSRNRQELARAQRDLERSATALDDLRKEANAADLNLVPGAIQRSKRRLALLNQIELNRKALALSCGNQSPRAFIAGVRAADTDQLPVQLDELSERKKYLEEQKLKKVRERDEIDRQFQLREAVGELHKASIEKHSAAARIEELAMQYLEQQIGAKLLARAMELYRAKHQDPLLKRAGEYFAELTCGSFGGLAIEYENNARVLKCVRPSGGATLAIEDMSDGARDQLFLALRLAYIENHCATNTPCPVILDDVLVAFDDNRASAALKVLRDLSHKTQVLVFTHHAHHVQLAEAVLGTEGFQLHELGTQISTAERIRV